jgi:hypothetical protein
VETDEIPLVDDMNGLSTSPPPPPPPSPLPSSSSVLVSLEKRDVGLSTLPKHFSHDHGHLPPPPPPPFLQVVAGRSLELYGTKRQVKKKCSKFSKFSIEKKEQRVLVNMGPSKYVGVRYLHL